MGCTEPVPAPVPVGVRPHHVIFGTSLCDLAAQLLLVGSCHGGVPMADTLTMISVSKDARWQAYLRANDYSRLYNRRKPWKWSYAGHERSGKSRIVYQFVHYYPMTRDAGRHNLVHWSLHIRVLEYGSLPEQTRWRLRHMDAIMRARKPLKKPSMSYLSLLLRRDGYELQQ